ncbi:MAG: hypothetical protein IJ291_00835 [Lachnospiraceae bacterium]|nr:hypothetical protein [Lachnospiraceae bacterium]
MKKKIVKLMLLCGMVVTLVAVSACGSANVSVDTEFDVNISTEQNTENGSEEVSGQEEESTSEQRSEAVKTVVLKLVKEEAVSYSIEDDGSKTEEGNTVKTYEYDEKGNQIKRINYEDGELDITVESTYDEMGNLITEKTAMGETGIVRTFTYAYDEDGNKIREEFDNGKEELNDLNRVTEFTYDENGNCIYSKGEYADGSVSSVVNSEYDENGNLIKESSLYGFAMVPVVTTYEYTYDYEGNIVKRVKKEDDGTETVDEYTYDENGNVLTHLEEGGYILAPGRYEYTYDAKGNCTKEVLYFADTGSHWHTIEYTYDENGNLVEKIFYTDDARIETTYTYVEMEITE